MEYLSVAKTAEKWGVSQRSVRNYCSEGRIPGAFLTGKAWNIPCDAKKPVRIRRKDAAPAFLPDILKREKASGQSGGIYHKIQIELTYYSNHMEGSRLTHDQTRYIYETNTIGVTDESINVDETASPEETAKRMRSLLAEYHKVQKKNCGICWIFMYALNAFIPSRMTTAE